MQLNEEGYQEMIGDAYDHLVSEIVPIVVWIEGKMIGRKSVNKSEFRNTLGCLLQEYGKLCNDKYDGDFA